MQVFVLQYEHKHGIDVSVYATEALARAARAGIARDYWADRADQTAPDDATALTDEEVADAYFEDNDREFAGIEAHTVVGAE